MLRRNVRLRKEYLFRKGLEEKEQVISERKRQLQSALDHNKSIPTELRKGRQDAKLRKKLNLTDVVTATPKTHIDDEYGNAASRDPKLLVTTSRDPSASLARFVKEVALLFPTAQRVNRGQYGIDDLAHLCRTNDVTDMVVVHEHRGKPDGLVVSHFPFGPTAYFSISDVVMRHDLPERAEHMSEAPPHLVFHNFTSTLGLRVMSVLKYLFPVSKPTSHRVVTFANSNDVIYFRNHTWTNTAGTKQLTGKAVGEGEEDNGAEEVLPVADTTNSTGTKTVPTSVDNVGLDEIGPRMTLRLYKLELGTVEMKDVDTEWTLRPFFNSQKAALQTSENEATADLR